MTAHDKRTLEERLQWIADWSEPDIDLADAGTAREALDRIKAQAAEIERMRLTIIKLQGHQCALEAEIAHLREQIEDEREDAARAMREAAAREAATDRTIDAHGAHCRCTTCELNIVEGDIRCIPTGQFRMRNDAA